MLAKTVKYIGLLLLCIGLLQTVQGQKSTSVWKAQVALGINYPFTDGFVDGTFAQPINFPTVNLGIQHMLTEQYGVKLDYGFNRFANDDDSPEFKVNYSRINAQFIYDPTQYLTFLPTRVRTVLHAGPGIAFVTPLGNLGDNEQSYLNGLVGLEVHYAINEKVSVYVDGAYIHGFTSLDNYDPVLNGLGAFNGSLINITFGVSLSLSGCYYCN
ncbi:MAG: cell envelope biogenesis protein OmpA [Bacteroidota bacterium]